MSLPQRMLARVALAELLGMTLWFTATAASPALVREFGLGSAGLAWLTMAVQAGFVTGTLVTALTNLADAINARRLFALGCLAGAAANAAIVVAPSASIIIPLRFLTGVALAWVYPPGMKIAAGWFLERDDGLASHAAGGLARSGGSRSWIQVRIERARGGMA